MQFINQIVEIFIDAGIIHGAFLVIINKRNKKKLTPANIWLSILLLFISFSIAHSYYIAPYLSNKINNPFKINEHGILMISPLLWFYIQSLVNIKLKFKFKDFFHFIPYFTFFILIIPLWFNHGYEPYKNFLQKNNLTITIIIWIIVFIQYAYYFWKMICCSKCYYKRTKEELSDFKGYDIEWINYFLSIFLIIYIVIAIIIVWLIHTEKSTFFPPLISIILSFAIFILGYKGLFQRELELYPINNNITRFVDKSSNKIDFNSNDYQTIIDKLNLYLVEQKPYLDFELTLTSLAKQLEINRNVLSLAINTGMNNNFYNLINSYRVDQVKKYFEDPKYKKYTILAIAYEAGFASKATFYSNFKNFTGITPSEYRNRLL